MGLPRFTTRFGPGEYDAHLQNWAVAQATDGSIWVGNTEGLLRYDGVRWSRIAIPGEITRSLAVADDGRLFVGGDGTFGVVEADSHGTPRYVALAGPAATNAEDVWATIPVGRAVYFQTFDRIYRYEGARVTVIAEAPAGARFHKAFAVPRGGRRTSTYGRREPVFSGSMLAVGGSSRCPGGMPTRKRRSSRCSLVVLAS